MPVLLMVQRGDRVWVMASATFSALSHGANWIEVSAKQDPLRETRQAQSPVLPKTDYVMPIRVLRSTEAFQKSQDDYRMFREQARFLTDLTDNLSRMVNRLAR